MHFEHPQFFWLLLIFPLAWLILPLLTAVLSRKDRHTPFVYFSRIDFKVYRGWRAWSYQIALLSRWVCLFFLIIALASPSRQYQETTRVGIDIILAIDVSLSMETKDMDENRTRLEIVKSVVKEFISKREGDRLGIVIFGRYAVRQCPLTSDHDSLQILLDQIQLRDIEGDKTAIGAGLAISCLALERSTCKTKIVLLLTDGINNISEIPVNQSVALAKGMNIRVYCIGVGTQSPIHFGDGNMDLDENMLKNIAKETHGKYFYAGNTDMLQSVYHAVDILEKSKYEVKTRFTDSFYEWYVLLALIFLIGRFIVISWLAPIP